MNTLNHILAKSLWFLSDKYFTQLTFILKHGRFPSLKQPVTFNEKLLFLKLNERNKIYKNIVDKYKVRSLIKDKIGEEYLVPLIGVYKNSEEIIFEDLPNKFVLKLTNGSQHNLICKNRNDIKWEREKQKINKWLKYNFYKRTREWPYKDNIAKIVIEEFLSDQKGDLNDYKFWCFNGEPKFIQIDSDRFSNHKRNFYSINFDKELGFKISHPSSSVLMKKPINYDKMVDVAKRLSKGFKFIRVDLYNVDGKIYFGELTLYPGNCNEPIKPFKFEKEIGNMLIL